MDDVTAFRNKEQSSFILWKDDCNHGDEDEGTAELLYNKAHNASLLAEVASLHRDSLLTDVTLKGAGGDQTFPCHRIILAASSAYFRAMFTSGELYL